MWIGRGRVGVGMRCRCVWCARGILDYVLAVLLSDMLKYKDSEGVVVAAQGHGMQDDYLSMKTVTKFREAPARSWQKPN